MKIWWQRRGLRWLSFPDSRGFCNGIGLVTMTAWLKRRFDHYTWKVERIILSTNSWSLITSDAGVLAIMEFSWRRFAQLGCYVMTVACWPMKGLVFGDLYLGIVIKNIPELHSSRTEAIRITTNLVEFILLFSGNKRILVSYTLLQNAYKVFIHMYTIIDENRVWAGIKFSVSSTR
jgi:hypothetical protein